MRDFLHFLQKWGKDCNERMFMFKANRELEMARMEIARLHAERERYEETMKKAFMRGVCALNLEAMSMFREGEEGGRRPPPPASSSDGTFSGIVFLVVAGFIATLTAKGQRFVYSAKCTYPIQLVCRHSFQIIRNKSSKRNITKLKTSTVRRQPLGYLRCLTLNTKITVPVPVLSFHGFKTNQFNDLLPVGLLAQLVERCTSITEVKSSNPVQFFFRLSSRNCKSCVYNCDDLLIITPVLLDNSSNERDSTFRK